MRPIFHAALATAAFLLFPFWNVNAQPVTLRYGQIPSTIKTISALSFYIGQRKGFFAQEGVSLEMMPIEGGAANMVVALNKSAVDITRTATPYLIQDVLKGSDGVAIAGETLTPIYSLIAKPEIRTFADLKGKVVGLSLAVDTMPLGQPEDFVFMNQGYQRLGVSTDAVPSFLFTVSAVRKSWGEKNKDALVRYVRGLASSYRFMRDPNNRDEVVRMAIAVTGSSEEIARQTLALYFDPDRGVVPKQAELDIKGMGQVIQFMAEAGELKPPLPPPERFIDLQYLRAAGLQ
jgi:ABC-type nitrate/sulfonate/bicarbonate transport system substrate-binding protein